MRNPMRVFYEWTFPRDGGRKTGPGRPCRDETDDGVIVLTCDRDDTEITLRGFAVLVAGFLLFKAVVMVQLGVSPYVSAIGELQRGSYLERAGAMVMRPDPISRLTAVQMVQLLR